MNRLNSIITVTLSVVFVIALTGSALSQDFLVKENVAAPQGPAMVASEILVKFKPGVSGAEIANINSRHGATEISTSPYAGFKRLKIPPRKTVAEMVAIYSQNPNVEYAEPNYIAHAFLTPNDFYYAPYQWHLDNPVYGGINMEAAWDVTTGNQGVVVAVVDTGVAYEDYQETVTIGKRRTSTVTYQKAPDLANTNFVAGYDFINNDDHPNDDEGHGTHVTGTIVQSTNNGIGVAGVAFNTSIMPVKVLDSSGSGSYAAIANGIYYAAGNAAYNAAGNRADVISMSLGGSSGSTTLMNALAYAHGRGVTIVCASGNDGSATTVSYPAAYDDYCIAVGATRYDEAVAGYSNRGASLDLTAPGGDTSVDQNGDGYVDGVLQQTFGSSPTDFGYYFYQGTSMATPHVSGVVALLLAQDATRTPAEIRSILQATAKDKGASGWDPNYGWGILDAAAALNYDAVPNQVPTAVINGPVSGTEDIAISFDGLNSTDDDSDPLTYQWNFGDGTTAAGASATHSYTAGGNYIVTLVVNDGKASSAPASAALTINEVNDPPVADAGADQSAQVGQAVSFNAAGSYDIDDGIATYLWEFGDGTDATEPITSHSYAAAGGYTAKLTVTDVGGLTDSDEAAITVSVTPVVDTLTASIDMSLSERATRKKTFVSANAAVSISDASGPVDGVVVYGYWGDSPTSVVSSTTGTNGQVVFSSSELRDPASGTVYTFTLTETVKAGYSSTPAGETSDTVTY